MSANSMVQVRRTGHRFSEVPNVSIPRSQFDRSHGHKTTVDFDLITPIMVEEVIPGDTITCKVRGFMRMFSPLKSPVMDNMWVDFHFFFVPNRLVWTNWEKFNGARDNPGDNVQYTIPKLAPLAAITSGTVADYMGLPIGLNTANVTVNALPFRAFGLIYNEWFRDQNLIDSVNITKSDADGVGYDVNTKPFKRAKKHDYFTSALPWPQKPNPDYPNGVTIPLGQVAPVLGIGVTTQTFVDGPVTAYESNGQSRSYGIAKNVAGTANTTVIEGDSSSGGFPQIYADLSAATGTSINQLRESFQIQRLLERDARGGTRYVEILKAHFGVTSPDFRLQRPEYLGGGKAYINVSPVAQTSQTPDSGGTPQANLAATGTGVISQAGFAKSFVEHGYIIGMVTARADLTYHQGLHRMWARRTRFDFFWPSLSRLGEQSILNQEIYVSNSTATDEAVFGYQERYAEYRYAPSRISGLFRPAASGNLDIWHLAENFASLPALNQTFIEQNTPTDRIKAVQSSADLIMDLWFDMKAARPMPVFGVPGMIDHF